MPNQKLAKELNKLAKSITAKRLAVYLKDLPREVVHILKRYKCQKNTIEIETKDSFTPWSGDDGTRGFYVLVSLASWNVIDSGMGSWGGSNAFVTNDVDERKQIKVPNKCFAITGITGGRNLAIIIIREDDLDFLIPQQENDTEKNDLTEKEWNALKVICTIKSGYRRDEFYLKRLGEYSADNPIIKSLEKKGLVKISRVGIQYTPKGRTLYINNSY